MLRLYQEQLYGQIPPGGNRAGVVDATAAALNYHAAQRMFERANGALGPNWTWTPGSPCPHRRTA